MKNAIHISIFIMMLTGMVFLSSSSIAATADCEKTFYSPDDYNREHPLKEPHPQLVESLKQAMSGNADELKNMAVSYDIGHLVSPCPEKALFWYQKAAAKGDADAIKWVSRYEQLQRHEYGNAPQVIREVTRQASTTVNKRYTAGNQNYESAQYNSDMFDALMSKYQPHGSTEVQPNAVPQNFGGMIPMPQGPMSNDTRQAILENNRAMSAAMAQSGGSGMSEREGNEARYRTALGLALANRTYGGNNTEGVPQTDVYTPPPPIPLIPNPPPIVPMSNGGVIIPLVGGGGAIDTNGQYYINAGSGYINTSTGEFVP